MPERGRRVLIVEDDYFIADDLATDFEKAGMVIAGPVPPLAKALRCIDEGPIDGAVLDINLDGEKVYEVADALMSREEPMVFVTGYERPSIPDRYRDVPLCLEPVASSKVLDELERLIGP